MHSFYTKIVRIRIAQGGELGMPARSAPAD
jgi:hypothetical protein